jgi:hypothetical protein
MGAARRASGVVGPKGAEGSRYSKAIQDIGGSQGDC